MKFLSNAHTHTRYCDGKNTPEEMLLAAQKLGFVSLGFSGHGDQGFDFDYSMEPERQEKYRTQLRTLQAAARQEKALPRLWVGLEQDAFASAEQKRKHREQFDYLLGSTHYLCRDYGGRSVAVDGDMALLKSYVQDVFEGDMLAMVQTYFDTHVEMLLADRPDIIGHFDLVRKHARIASLFDDTCKAYRNIALMALERAFPCDSVMEVNLGGMARGYGKEPYPSKELLLAWRDMGGKITLTSDCHDAALLDYGFAPMLAELREMGYRSIHRLGTGDTLWDEIEL